MTSFLHDDFLLDSPLARRLYHDHAAAHPIVDFHNHLPSERIATNQAFRDLTELWLEGDHYKWRAMRACGVDEALITGHASPWEKFRAWASVVPATAGNPLFAWTHLELRRYFGVTVLLSAHTAGPVWERVNEMLASAEFTPRALLNRMDVELIGTTDDPTDSLEHHCLYRKDPAASFAMLPTFRPDQALAPGGSASWNAWRGRLGAATASRVANLAELLAALDLRAQFFHETGCRMADHGLTVVPTGRPDPMAAQRAFDALAAGANADPQDLAAMRMAILDHLADVYTQLGWTAQFHLGALRNPNGRLFGSLGPDTGFDAIGDPVPPSTVAAMLDRWASDGNLPRAILYNLNPADNHGFAALCGSFPAAGCRAAVRHGAAWWFLDQRDGIEQQLTAWASLGLLWNFPGMITDSRSFLSFPRHEYFRRIFCGWLAREVMRGLLPDDDELLRALIARVCVMNARELAGTS